MSAVLRGHDRHDEAEVHAFEFDHRAFLSTATLGKIDSIDGRVICATDLGSGDPVHSLLTRALRPTPAQPATRIFATFLCERHMFLSTLMDGVRSTSAGVIRIPSHTCVSGVVTVDSTITRDGRFGAGGPGRAIECSA